MALSLNLWACSTGLVICRRVQFRARQTLVQHNSTTRNWPSVFTMTSMPEADELVEMQAQIQAYGCDVVLADVTQTQGAYLH